MGPLPPFYHLCSSFLSTEQKNSQKFSGRQDAISDCQSRRQGRWPLNHHHGQENSYFSQKITPCKESLFITIFLSFQASSLPSCGHHSKRKHPSSQFLKFFKVSTLTKMVLCSCNQCCYQITEMFIFEWYLKRCGTNVSNPHCVEFSERSKICLTGA